MRRLKAMRFIRLRWLALIAVTTTFAACGEDIVKALTALGEAPVTEVRIAGASFISLDKQDGGDGFTVSDGFMCVVHDPGCGWVGNSGSDEFFGPAKPLPLLAQIVETEFTPVAPPGLSTSAPGGIGGWGSFGASQKNGTGDGTVASTVDWSNACQGQYGGKNLYYRISFRVRIRGDVSQLNEPTFDPAIPPAARCGEGTPTIIPSVPMPSGFLGSVKVCNPSTQKTSGTLLLTAMCNPAQPGATFACMMNESISMEFDPSGGGQPSSTPFMTKQIYQQGSWTITKAQVQGLTGALPGLPLSVQVPGLSGTPILDFSGGRCGPL